MIVYSRNDEIVDKILNNKSLFYKIFNNFHNKDNYDFRLIIRNEFYIPTMQANKILHIIFKLLDKYEIEEILDNIEKNNPEYII